MVPVRVRELVRGDVPRRLRHLRGGEHEHRQQRAPVRDEEDDEARRGQRRGRRPARVEPRQRDGKRRRHGERLEHQKDDEVAVVPLPDRVPHPGAVVVEPAHAPVRHPAVFRAPGLDELARRAQRAPVPGPELGVVQVFVRRANLAGAGAGAREPGDAAAAAGGLGLDVAPALLTAAGSTALARAARVDEARVVIRDAVHHREARAGGQDHHPTPRRHRHVGGGHPGREDDRVHEERDETEDERRARHRHALGVPELPLGAPPVLVLLRREEAAEALVPLLRRELRRGGPLHVPRVEQRRAARLREDVRRLGLAADRGPVERRAPFLIRARDVRVAVQQKLHRVGEALVRGPVEGRAPVVVVRVHVRVPAHLEVVDHARVSVLRRDVHGVVPAAVRLVEARAGAKQELGARERAAHARPVQRRLLVLVRRVHRRALLDQVRRDRDAVVQSRPLEGEEPAEKRRGVEEVRERDRDRQRREASFEPRRGGSRGSRGDEIANTHPVASGLFTFSGSCSRYSFVLSRSPYAAAFQMSSTAGVSAILRV